MTCGYDTSVPCVAFANLLKSAAFLLQALSAHATFLVSTLAQTKPSSLPSTRRCSHTALRLSRLPPSPRQGALRAPGSDPRHPTAATKLQRASSAVAARNTFVDSPLPPNNNMPPSVRAHACCTARRVVVAGRAVCSPSRIYYCSVRCHELSDWTDPVLVVERACAAAGNWTSQKLRPVGALPIRLGGEKGRE